MQTGIGVNLLLCTTAHGTSSTVVFIADDEAAAQAVLHGAGIEYLLRPALTVRMENLPGAGVTDRLPSAARGYHATGHPRSTAGRLAGTVSRPSRTGLGVAADGRVDHTYRLERSTSVPMAGRFIRAGGRSPAIMARSGLSETSA